MNRTYFFSFDKICLNSGVEYLEKFDESDRIEPRSWSKNLKFCPDSDLSSWPIFRGPPGLLLVSAWHLPSYSYSRPFRLTLVRTNRLPFSTHHHPFRPPRPIFGATASCFSSLLVFEVFFSAHLFFYELTSFFPWCRGYKVTNPFRHTITHLDHIFGNTVSCFSPPTGSRYFSSVWFLWTILFFMIVIINQPTTTHFCPFDQPKGLTSENFVATHSSTKHAYQITSMGLSCSQTTLIGQKKCPIAFMPLTL